VDIIVNKKEKIKWEIDADVSNIKEYKIYKDGKFLETSPVRSYIAKSLKTGQTYEFAVSSVSLVGIESDKSNIVNVTIPFPSSIHQQLTDDGILVYPNPAKDLITIKTGGLPGQSFSFYLVDLYGHIFISKTVEKDTDIFNQRIDMVPEGMYIIKLVSDKTCITKTLVVQ